MADSYVRNAKVIRVIDGDTVELNIDLGFDLWSKRSTRLAGINAPEVHGATKQAGIDAKVHLIQLLPVDLEVTVETVKTQEKYGRYLARIYRQGETASINSQMVVSGFAVEKDYD